MTTPRASRPHVRRPGPDPVAMAIALDPSLITEAAEVTIARGDETRGQLIIDRRHTAAPLNVTLVRRANAPGFRQVLFDTCAREPRAITR